MSKKKNNGVAPAVDPQADVVVCVHCHKSGDPKEIFVSPHNEDIEIPEFFCEPRELSGSTDGMVIYCRECALKFKDELRERFPDWFRTHDLLPSVVQTRKCETEFGKQAGPAKENARKLMDSIGLVPDPEMVCSNCGHHHGEIHCVRSLPNVIFRFTSVDHVAGGWHRTIAEMMEHLLCRDCEPEYYRDKTYWLDKTRRIVAEREQRDKQQEADRQARLARKQQKQANQPVPKDIDPRTKFIPAAPRQGGAIQATGTHGRR